MAIYSPLSEFLQNCDICYRPRKTGGQKFSDIQNISLTGAFLSPRLILARYMKLLVGNYNGKNGMVGRRMSNMIAAMVSLSS
jgi:hypothetical protein